MPDLNELDALFDAAFEKKVEPPSRDIPMPDFFSFEHQEEEKTKSSRLVFYKCGTRFAVRISDGAEQGNTPQVQIPLEGYDAIKLITRHSDGHVVSYPVSHVDVGYFALIKKVVRTGLGTAGFGQSELSFGGDYQIEGALLILTERLAPGQKVIVEGKAWATGYEAVGEREKPKRFPFPYQPNQVGTKPICNMCPNQFACLAGAQQTFGMREYKVVKAILGDDKDPFEYT